MQYLYGEMQEREDTHPFAKDVTPIIENNQLSKLQFSAAIDIYYYHQFLISFVFFVNLDLQEAVRQSYFPTLVALFPLFFYFSMGICDRYSVEKI